MAKTGAFLDAVTTGIKMSKDNFYVISEGRSCAVTATEGRDPE
jgi:hypothetical protein